MGGRGCSEFITRCFCCSFVLRGRTPHTLLLLQCGVPPTGDSPPRIFSDMSPSHGLQLFPNCSSMCHFYRVQSFRNRLLQRGSPTGSQVLPANLLQRGLFFPQDLSGACSTTSFPWGPSLLQAHPPALVVLHGLQVEICSTVNLHGLQGTAASPWAAPRAAGESLLWCLEHLLPLLLH